tara:strand:- start:271 stop:1098 length:828 start_codon:yes stop_codon:yes gene_type:complete
MDTETINSLIPTTITLIVTSLFGLLIGILTEKFKNRLRIITYEIYTQNLKPNLSKNFIGNLKISLNEREIDSLRSAYVEFENKNNLDLENVVITFNISPGAVFQGSEGYVQNSLSWLNWTESHNNYFQNVLSEFNALPTDGNGLKQIPDNLQNQINYVNQNQEYLIPVFNRKDTAHFNFLFEDPLDGSTAILYTSIKHKSVRLEKKVDDDKIAKKNLWTSIGIGIALVIIIIAILSYTYPENKILIIISAIIGFSYSFVGHLIVGVFNRIRDYFK